MLRLSLSLAHHPKKTETRKEEEPKLYWYEKHLAKTLNLEGAKIMTEPNELERFMRWFVKPFEKLKEIPDGDGGFIALSMALFLCERYYKAEVNLQDEESTSRDDLFKNRAAEDLNVNQTFFLHFWQVYRNGMQHQASPKTYEVNHNGQNLTYKWSMDAAYDDVPSYFEDQGIRYICINPWKFCERMIQKIIDKPDCLTKSVRYELGRVREITTPTPHQVPGSSTYP